MRAKTMNELVQDAQSLARSFHLVHYRGNLYVPLHFETGEVHVTGTPEETLWEAIGQAEIRELAAQQYSTMFTSDTQLRNFHFMVSQAAQQEKEIINTVMVKTDDGLMVLNSEGGLVPPDGSFVANTLLPKLVTDEAEQQAVFDVIVNWLGSEEEAVSLLHHFATVLAPGWSAAKYVLLLGEGRNGKGVLLRMLERLFGRNNMSQVPRQEIAARSPMTITLNGKLINLVFDGPMEYVKDSGTEKTLTVGEPAFIKDLYTSTPVLVQTNALFVEALNKEPLSRDKSPALQKRLARFHFNKVFERDREFELHMWSERTMGAFLGLLINHYVQEHEASEKLALTETSKELQLEHMLHNSLVLQFLKQLWLDGNGSLSVIGEELDALASRFISWRQTQGDKSNWDLAEAAELLKQALITEPKSKRIGSKVGKVRVITDYRTDTERFVDSLEGGFDEAAFEAMVED